MTERLYYTDAYCTRFSARVIEQLAWEDHPAVVLDRTAFYPTSGGQPADQGTLGGVKVLDVVVREEDGAIVHVLSETPSEFGKLGESEVEGVLDWPRRFDHMQQHTGQHILSAAFEQLLDADTVGFHLGAEMSTIDVVVNGVTRPEPAAVVPVEELANQVVWDDRPVTIRFVGPDELTALPLRMRSKRPLAVEGAVRIVEIGGPAAGSGQALSAHRRGTGGAGSAYSFDVNPCGGTHVARTGEIGLIKIVRLDYRGDETRVEFLCGGRALRDYKVKNDMANRLASMLTVGQWELDQAVERLQAAGKQLRRDLRQARKRLLQVEVDELAATAVVHGHGHELYRIVWRVWEPQGHSPGKSPRELRALAQELARRPISPGPPEAGGSLGVVALLASIGERTHLCFARPETLASLRRERSVERSVEPGVELDVAALLRDACAQLGGKGGGRPHLAQGSAPPADAARVESVISSLLKNL